MQLLLFHYFDNKITICRFLTEDLKNDVKILKKLDSYIICSIIGKCQLFDTRNKFVMRY